MSSRVRVIPIASIPAAPQGGNAFHRGIQIVRCRVCGRRLSAPESVRAGIGPVCALGAKGRAAARLLGPLGRLRIDPAEDPTQALRKIGLDVAGMQPIDLDSVRAGIATISTICESVALSRPAQRPRLALAEPYVVGLNSVLNGSTKSNHGSLTDARRAQSILYALGSLAHYLNVLGGLNETDVATGVVNSLTMAVDQVVDGSGLRVPFDSALRKEMHSERSQTLNLFDIPETAMTVGPRVVSTERVK